MRRVAFIVSLIVLIVACGDDGGGTIVDAQPSSDAAGSDGPVSIDASVQVDAGNADAITDDATAQDANTDDGGNLMVPLINEAVKQHEGANAMEYIEVFGSPNTDYSAFTVLQIDCDNGTGLNPGRIVTAHPLATTDPNGFWWTGYLNAQLENGSQTLLLVHGFNGSAGTSDIDADNNGTIDAVFWTTIVDAVAFDDQVGGDLLYAGLAVVPMVGGASRIPNGTDTNAASDWKPNVFNMAMTPAAGEAFNTPGAVNNAN